MLTSITEIIIINRLNVLKLFTCKVIYPEETYPSLNYEQTVR